jgi:hypothetical protein
MTRDLTRSGRARWALALGAVLLGGCASPIPSETPTASPSSSGSATTARSEPPTPAASAAPEPSSASVQLQVFGRRLEHCELTIRRGVCSVETFYVVVITN